MKRRKVLAMLMTAVMTFTSVAPETALVALAGDDAAEDVVVEELPFDLKGMPEDYELDEVQYEMKAALKENDALNVFKGMTEGIDYEADKVFCIVDSEEEALTVAEAYNGELELYAQGVAEIKLNGNITVEQAFAVGADETYAMPVVEPNYITYLDEPEIEAVDLLESDYDSAAAAVTAHNSAWERMVLGTNGAKPALGNPDTYLKDPSIIEYQWMHDMIDTYEAWEVELGKATINVAVIDSGVNPEHPDLAGRVTQIKIGDITPTAYTSSHGTHVAGIIGASAGNGAGVAGVAPKVNILSMNIFKYFDDGNGGKTDGCSLADEARAINECVKRKVPVANMSLGGFTYSASFEYEVMKPAANAGVCIFVAMGNENGEIKSYPAAYTGAIAVASVNCKGDRSYFSDYGKWCDIAAPGGLIMSCYNPKADNYAQDKKNGSVDASGYYGLMSGTSMACPVAAGAAALYMSHYGVVSPTQITKVMQNTGMKTSSAKIGKILNVGKMLGAKSGGKAKAFQGDDMTSLSFEIEDAEGDAYVVYTTDGSDPVLLDGEVVNGQIYDGVVTLEAAETEKVVTVKSKVVTSAGEIGEIESATFTVPAAPQEIVTAAAKSAITITADNNRVADNKANLYTVNVPKTSYDDSIMTLNAGTEVTWKSSNPKVVEVVTAAGGSTVIKAVKTGTAKITAQGADKSKATITVKVVVPASSIKLTPNRDDNYGGRIGVGKSKKIELVLGDTYGKPSVTKVEWDWSINNNKTLTEAAKKAKVVTINKSGKISVNKSKWNSVVGADNYLYVTAKTTDGTGLTATAYYVVQRATSELKVYDPSSGKLGVKTYLLPSDWMNNRDDGKAYSGYVYVCTDAYLPTVVDIDVSSSNPDVVGGMPAGYVGKYTIGGKSYHVIAIEIWAGNSAFKRGGSAKLTIKAKDGSNKKTTLSFKIK